MKGTGIALLLMLAGWVTMTAQAPAPSSGNTSNAGNVENGKRVFMKQGCFRCHGTEGQGGAGPRLAPNPPATAAFIQYVRKPSGDLMPPYTNQVTDAELADVRAYLAAIPPPPPLKDIPLLNQ